MYSGTDSLQARGRATMVAVGLATLLLPFAWAGQLAAQDPDRGVPTGVRIGLLYETTFRPRLAIRPFAPGSAESPALAEVARGVHEIIRRDLDYSDRFEMLRDLPPQAAQPDLDHGDYRVWNAMGVVFLVTGALEPASDGGHLLRIVLHDVVYTNVKESATFRLPAEGRGDFRMSVHAVADQIVRWATGHRGKAASRIAYIRPAADGSYELMVVDSDGENAQRIMATEHVLLSPAWSPDGRRLMYAIGKPNAWEIHERNMATGQVRVVSSRPGLNSTPSYSPDGRRIVLALSNDRGEPDIFEYDVARDCCLRRLTQSPRADLSPTISPDGRRIAFNSDRLGPPHIFVMEAGGGDIRPLTRFVYGEAGHFTAPEWSPTNSLVVFHGRSRGEFQIMVADADRPGAAVQQITQEGRSEDPSWAPDGRHVVFTGRRSAGQGLFVVDTVTGRLRSLILGGRLAVPAWSPPLLDASALLVSGGI